MKDTPKFIYLQVTEEDFDECEGDFNKFMESTKGESTTWCEDRINDTDIEYVLNEK